MDWAQHIEALAGGDFDGWFQEEIRPLVQPMVIGLLEEVTELLRTLQIEASADEDLERDRWVLFEAHAEKTATSADFAWWPPSRATSGASDRGCSRSPAPATG